MSHIRPLLPADLAAVLAIQAASPEAAAWSRQAYEDMLSDSTPNRCLIATQGNQPAGFVCFRVMEHEAELLNLAVLPAFRRLGMGAQLLQAMVGEATGSGATDIYLEVRDSNVAALGLYKRFAFELNRRRPGYYTNPPEDALTLRLRLRKANS